MIIHQMFIGMILASTYFLSFVFVTCFFSFSNRPTKRKLLTNKNNKKRRKIEEDSDEPIDTGLTLTEDEELALKMLDV